MNTLPPWMSKLLNDLEKEEKKENLQQLHVPPPPQPVQDKNIIDETHIVEESQVIIEIDIA